MLSNENISLIIHRIGEKKVLFQEFMIKSQEMVGSEFDDLVRLDEERNLIRSKIEVLDEEIKKIYENESDADYIVRVLKNVENRGDVPNEYLQLFDVSQDLISLIYRIHENETQVLTHLNVCKEKLLEQIKENQQASKVVGYLKALDETSLPEGSMLSNNSRNA